MFWDAHSPSSLREGLFPHLIFGGQNDKFTHSFCKLAYLYNIRGALVPLTPGANGWFSNYTYAPIVLKDIRWATSEALYQATRFPDYPAIQAAILNAPYPGKAKKIGRYHLEKTRSDWFSVRVEVMRWTLQHKALQSPGFKKALYEKTLVEYFPGHESFRFVQR